MGNTQSKLDNLMPIGDIFQAIPTERAVMSLKATTLNASESSAVHVKRLTDINFIIGHMEDKIDRLISEMKLYKLLLHNKETLEKLKMLITKIEKLAEKPRQYYINIESAQSYLFRLIEIAPCADIEDAPMDTIQQVHEYVEKKLDQIKKLSALYCEGDLKMVIDTINSRLPMIRLLWGEVCAWKGISPAPLDMDLRILGLDSTAP